VNLGEILFRRGDHRGAIRELEAVVRVEPLNQHAALWLARAYTASGRQDDAVRVYDRLLQAAAAGAAVDPIVVLAATDLDLERRRPERAAERLSHLPASLSRTPETLVARGSTAEADGGFEEADRLFSAALAVQPANMEALSRLVDLRLRRGRTSEASRIAGDAVRRFPDSPQRQALAGETALAERRYADASRAFRAALALAPDSMSVRLELARAELAQRRTDAALRALDAVSAREAEVLRGAAYSQQGDWRHAAAAYARAVAMSSPTIELLNALGNAQLEAGQPEEAAATLQRSLSMKTDQPEIRELLERARRSPAK
jgi:tetratricopeptide (TPR) repeat protein